MNEASLIVHQIKVMIRCLENKHFLNSCLTGVVYIMEEVEKNVNFSYRLISKSINRNVET